MEKRRRIFLSTPTIHSEEHLFVKEAFDTNWVAPLGPNVDSFEREVSNYVGIKYAVALASGTASIHMAVKLASIKSNAVVFCSDMTFAASVNPVSYEQGTQVFIDSERSSWNMDPKALDRAFKKYPSCKSVIVTNLYGTPANLCDIRSICEEHSAVLIEDAAESLSATLKGQQTGTFGMYNALSFNGNKLITTSGGGMLLSNNEEAIKKVRFWATQSRDTAPWYQHSEIGYNYRMSNIVAGIGRGQLIHIEEHRKQKEIIHERYKKGFEGLPLEMNPHTKDSKPNYWLSCILLDKEAAQKIPPVSIMEELETFNIESRPIWKPMHLQPLYYNHDCITAGRNNVGEDIFMRGLCLPSDIKMTADEQDEVISIIARIIRKKL